MTDKRRNNAERSRLDGQISYLSKMVPDGGGVKSQGSLHGTRLSLVAPTVNMLSYRPKRSDFKGFWCLRDPCIGRTKNNRELLTNAFYKWRKRFGMNSFTIQKSTNMLSIKKIKDISLVYRQINSQRAPLKHDIRSFFILTQWILEVEVLETRSPCSDTPSSGGSVWFRGCGQ